MEFVVAPGTQIIVRTCALASSAPANMRSLETQSPRKVPADPSVRALFDRLVRTVGVPPYYRGAVTGRSRCRRQSPLDGVSRRLRAYGRRESEPAQNQNAKRFHAATSVPRESKSVSTLDTHSARTGPEPSQLVHWGGWVLLVGEKA
jgi:hypothetical protein